MRENADNGYAANSQKPLETPLPVVGRAAARIRGEVLLPYPRLTTQKEINAHRVKLQQLERDGIAVWLLLDTVTDKTRLWLNFLEHTFHQTERDESIQNRLRGWAQTSQTSDRIYLLAQENTDAPCYDITDYIQRCIEGDRSVATRLKGRTIFRFHQTETHGYDLLCQQGVRALAHQILERYIHEFHDLIQYPVVGLCCTFPTFLSPLKATETAVPWSDAFAKTLEPELLAHLPLIHYETYDSATIRSRFWERLTQQFAKVCVGGLKEFAHQHNLQCAVNFPSTASALDVDIGTILKTADRPILSADKLDKPKPFLIAKQIASQRPSERSRFESPDCPAQISLCRSDPHTDQFVADGVLGFNSWMHVEDSRNGDRVHTDDQSAPRSDEAHYSSQFLSVGVPKRSVLILSPIHSLWTKPDSKGWNWLLKEWAWLCQTVWELGYDFDITSETLFAAGEVDKRARALALNSEYYSSVLLPSCLALREETVGILTQFVKARGGLIASDPVPYLLNGRIGLDPYPLERLLYRRRTAILRGTATEKAAALKRLLRKQIRLPIQIYAKPDNLPTHAIISQHRESADLNLFYLFNRGEQPIETLIEIQWKSTVEEWDPTDGERHALSHWHADRKTYTQLSFDSGQGRFIVARRRGS